MAYKFFAEVLQIHLQLILMEIILPNYSAFLPIRYILNNLFLTHETIEFAKSSDQPLMFLKQDFSKAYHKVDFKFLFLAMEKPKNGVPNGIY